MIMSLVLLCSCSEEVSDVSLDPGYDFFPLELNAYRTYEIQEVTFEVFQPDTTRYFLKEVVKDSMTAGDGLVTYLINRFKSPDSLSWKLDSVWTARRSEVVAVINENDVPFCKLVFPIKEGRTWDGNAFNVMDEQEYRFEQLSGYAIGSKTLESDKVIRVVIEDIPENLVNQDERYEVYGRGIGLLEKNYIQLSFCTLNCEEKGFSIGAIEKGRILSQKLIKYGVE